MIIAIGNDHAAVELKNLIVDMLVKQGHQVMNFGTDDSASYDYPLAGKAVGEAVSKKTADFGIAICGTGVGISLACNKVEGIRACCCSDALTARLSREHNDANVICFGARIIGPETAFEIVNTFLNTPFSQGERHIRRIKMIHDIENNKK